MKLTRKKITLIAPLLVLIAAAVYPFESVVVPPWRVKVVDVNGSACADFPVMETWEHYSLFLSPPSNSENSVTDQNGYVEFPERRVRAVGIRRLVMPIVTGALTIAHGSTGVSGTLHTSGLKDVAWLSYRGEGQLPDTARVEKCIVDSDLHQKEGALGNGGS